MATAQQRDCLHKVTHCFKTYITNLLQQKCFLVIFGEVVGGKRALNPRSYNNILVHHVEKAVLFKMCYSILSVQTKVLTFHYITTAGTL